MSGLSSKANNRAFVHPLASSRCGRGSEGAGLSLRSVALMPALALMLAGGFGCPPPNTAPTVAAPASPTNAATKGTPAASPASLSIKTSRPTFDGEKAFAHLQKQCDFG